MYAPTSTPTRTVLVRIRADRERFRTLAAGAALAALMLATIVATVVMLATGAVSGGTTTAAPAAPVLDMSAAPTGPRITYVVAYDGARRTRYLVSTRTGAVHNLPACAAEDGARPCVWDARRRGNGVGRSFAVLARHGDPVPVRPRIMRHAYLPSGY